ncbi:hypothetical protein FACS1894181_12700 [Bacteroidia bacterium]|nr:hypothetical protein FACS189438_0950 [Bacteroidia bacterium]GHV51189.1 hypothetical protein FACS1894181_12700 [Bacteroidia bacterium]
MKKKNTKEFLKDLPDSNHIDGEKVEANNYPVFCFKYLSEKSIKDCKDAKFFFKFLMRLQELSQLGWDEIRTSQRHSFGLEPIPLNKIKHQVIQESITPDVKRLQAFRAVGDNRVFLGIRKADRTFRVLFIETEFGDFYDHE